MLNKKIISLFALSAMLVLPAGIANANEMKLQTGNSKLTINQDGSINIQTNSSAGTTVIPGRVQKHNIYTRPNVRIQQNRIYGIRKYPTVKTPTMQCRANQSSRSITQRNSSGTTVNRTYSSTNSTTCQ